MQAGDRQRFAFLIDALAAQYGKPAEEALLEGYWMALDDLAIEAIEKAVRSAMRQCQFMPKAVELRELAGDMPIAQRAVHAWGAVKSAIAKHGMYRSVDFDDPVINATLRNLGGWQKLCATDSEEAEKWTRKDFERVYSTLCSSGITEEQAKYLGGIHEQDAVGKGLACQAAQFVLTGMPPQREGIVRQLSAPERLVLAGRPNREGIERVAEIVSSVGVRKAGL